LSSKGANSTAATASTASDSDTNLTTEGSQNRKEGPSVVDIHDSNSDTGSKSMGMAVDIEDSDDELGKHVELNLNPGS
jgi:hypothetical protein